MSRELKSPGPATCGSFPSIGKEEDRFFHIPGVVDRIETEL